MRRRATVVSILAAVALLAVLAGVLGCSRLSPSGNVSLAEAAQQSQKAYQDIQAYRYRMTLVQGPQRMRDIRNLFQQVEATIHMTTTGEVQKPDRITFQTEEYYVYESGERVEGFGGCGIVSVHVGTKSYARLCDGSWESRDVESSTSSGESGDTMGAYWDTLKGLATTTRLGTDTAHGTAVSVFEAEYSQDGAQHKVTVKVGADDGLVRYIKDESPGKTVEMERWDFDDPSIQIEAPVS